MVIDFSITMAGCIIMNRVDLPERSIAGRTMRFLWEGLSIR